MNVLPASHGCLTLSCCDWQALIKHKYGAVVLCKVSVKFSGAEDLRLLSCTFTFAGANAKMGLLTAGMPCSKHRIELNVCHKYCSCGVELQM